MNFKKIDPVVLANTFAFVLAFASVMALVGWGMYAVEKAKDYENPTEKALIKDGLL